MQLNHEPLTFVGRQFEGLRSCGQEQEQKQISQVVGFCHVVSSEPWPAAASRALPRPLGGPRLCTWLESDADVGARISERTGSQQRVAQFVGSVYRNAGEGFLCRQRGLVCGW